MSLCLISAYVQMRKTTSRNRWVNRGTTSIARLTRKAPRRKVSSMRERSRLVVRRTRKHLDFRTTSSLRSFARKCRSLMRLVETKSSSRVRSTTTSCSKARSHGMITGEQSVGVDDRGLPRTQTCRAVMAQMQTTSRPWSSRSKR